MIYTTRYGACPTCRFKYMSTDDEESPCFGCCHCKTAIMLGYLGMIAHHTALIADRLMDLVVNEKEAKNDKVHK